MLYKYVIHGCVCWLSQETIKSLEDERKALEDERKAFEEVCTARKQAEQTNDPMDWSIYSDLYKDYYGVRPRY